MTELDKRKKLAEEPFDYEITKGGLVLLYWGGKHIKTLAGKAAEKFSAEIEDLDEAAAQLLLAKATGNFKRGNERKS